MIGESKAVLGEMARAVGGGLAVILALVLIASLIYERRLQSFSSPDQMSCPAADNRK